MISKISIGFGSPNKRKPPTESILRQIRTNNFLWGSFLGRICDIPPSNMNKYTIVFGRGDIGALQKFAYFLKDCYHRQHGNAKETY